MRPLTDYEKYIRTEELLALQKPADTLSWTGRSSFFTASMICANSEPRAS